MKRLLLLTCFVAVTARAHDFWIEPSTFRPAVGEAVTTKLRVGEPFRGEPIVRSTELIDSFIARDANRQWDVPGFESRDPAGLVRVENPGLTIVGYRSRPYPHELPLAKYQQFLREEGVDLRVTAPTVVREQFTRYAKAAIQTGGGADLDRVLGFRYEIVREADGTFRLTFEGKPVANAFVAATNRDGTRIESRTGRDGRVKFNLDRPGDWLVTSVHVVRARAGSDADWESLWASLAFQR